MKKFLFLTTAFFLTASCAFSFFTAEAETGSDLDYSRAGYESECIYAADFLENYLGLELFENEREFFKGNSDFVFSYSDRIAGNYILSELDEREENVLITAFNYEYTAVNGCFVVWEPFSVNGIELRDNRVEVPVGDEDYVTVTYKAELAVDKNLLNPVLNLFVNTAKNVFTKLYLAERQYESDLAAFKEQEEEYNRYLDKLSDYESDLQLYNAFLSEYKDWQNKESDYQRYLSEYAEYEKELKEYEEYDKKYEEYIQQLALWENYRHQCEIYESELNKYNEALENPLVAKVRKQLDILAYMDVAAQGRTLSGAITGNAVSQVLAHLSELKDNLKKLRIDERSVKNAETATKNLRDLITNYRACTSENDKYIFYITNYTSLKNNFNNLLRSLDYLYSMPVVKTEIEKRDKVMQFRIMLAQLFEICNALDNEAVQNFEKYIGYTSYPREDPAENSKFDFDSNYRIDGLKPEEILGGSIIEDDNDAVPIGSGVPNVPAKPQKPAEVPKPENLGPKPSKPVLPLEVESPGSPPEEVSQPVPPVDVEQPVKPKKYIPTQWETDVARAYDSGEITERKEYASDVKITLSNEVLKYFRNSSTTVVSFYLNLEDEVPVYSTVAESGYVEYQGEIPTKTRPGYICVFNGWMDKNGNMVDLAELPLDAGDLKLYPHFNETPEICEVIWVIDGEEISESVLYGSVPYFSSTPEKADDSDGRHYRFISWDRPIVPVDEKTVKYTAVFESSVFITFKVEDMLTVVSVWPGETPVYRGSVEKPSDEYYYYVFKGWDKLVTPAISGNDKLYTAQFESKYILGYDGGGAHIERTEGGDYSVDCRSALASQELFDISKLMELIGGESCGITFLFPNVTLNFTKSEFAALVKDGVNCLKVKATQVFSYQYEYFVDIMSSSVSGEYLFTMTAYGVYDVNNSCLYLNDGNGNSVETRVKMNEDTISFTMKSGYVYEIYPLYSVHILQSDGISAISADKISVKPNQLVSLTPGELSNGRYLDYFYARDAFGNDVMVTGNTFKMPLTDVYVGAACGYIEYTVTFKADGKIISTRTYRYGDIVEVPQTAYRSPDGEYSYEFAGWAEEVLPVTGDAEYNALFNAKPLPESIGDSSSGIVKFAIWVLNNLVLVCVISSIILIGIVVGTIFIVRYVRKKRKSVN